MVWAGRELPWVATYSEGARRVALWGVSRAMLDRAAVGDLPDLPAATPDPRTPLSALGAQTGGLGGGVTGGGTGVIGPRHASGGGGSGTGQLPAWGPAMNLHETAARGQRGAAGGAESLVAAAAGAAGGPESARAGMAAGYPALQSQPQALHLRGKQGRQVGPQGAGDGIVQTPASVAASSVQAWPSSIKKWVGRGGGEGLHTLAP